MTQQLKDDLMLVADFDDDVYFIPVYAPNVPPSSQQFYNVQFNTWNECFQYCEKLNMGLKSPDEMWYVAPRSDKKRHEFGKQLKYNTSWDWQIPIWGRLDLVVTEREHSDYHHSIDMGNPQEGFEIIAEIIKRIKQ